MKKAIVLFSSLAALMMAIISSTACEKGVDCTELNATYDNKMKAIIDAKCVSCHKVGGTGAGVGIYTSYNSLKPNLEAAWNSVKTGQMPEAGSPKLTDEEKDAWECWAGSNFPEN